MKDKVINMMRPYKYEVLLVIEVLSGLPIRKTMRET